jgi:hypothetical protein
MLIYGRYVEVVAPPLVALGLAILSQQGFASRIRALLLALGGLSVIVVLIRTLAPDPGAANRWDVASLPSLTFQLGPAVLIGAAALGIAGAWLLGRIAVRRNLNVGLTGLALFLPVTAYGELNPVIDSERAVYPAGWTSPEPVARAFGVRSAAYDLAHYDVIGLYVVQWFLPHTRLELFDGSRQQPPSRYVLSGGAWANQHPTGNPLALWRARGRDEVLWRLDASHPRHDAASARSASTGA